MEIRTREEYISYIRRTSTIPTGQDGSTPIKLIEDMVNKLPIDWSNSNLKILDPGFGFGGYLFFAYLKLIQFHSEEHILNNMLYGVEIEDFRFELVKHKLKIKNLINGDFLDNKIFKDMKFDVIIGNPPYQDSSKESQNSGLWMDFIYKAAHLSKKYVQFVSPISWMSGSTTQKSNLLPLFTKNLIYLNLNTGKYFNGVGSTFCDYILDFAGSDVVEVKSKDMVENLNINNKLFLPKELNNLTISILDKVFSIENKIGFSTKQRVTPSGNGEYDILHTNGNIIKNEIDSKNSGILKVVVNKSGYLNPNITLLGTSQNLYWAPISSDETESIVDFLNSKIINVITQKLCKYSGFNSDIVMQNLPKLDFTKKYSDEELYNEFKLSDEEKDYIRKYEL